LTILAGAPKSGKSLLALNLALALSANAAIIGKKSKSIKNILYLPYEDSERRLQERINKIRTGLSINVDPKTFFLEGSKPPKIDDEILKEIGDLIKENKLDMIIIDTLGSAIKNTRKKGLSPYMDEYELLNKFQRFALDNKVCVLILHHTRKMKAENVFDEISGTRGISGAADANFVLQRNKYRGDLFIQGRDLEDAQYELELDKENLTWNFKGITNSISISPEQQSILDVFGSDSAIEYRPSEIAKILNKEDQNIRPSFRRLVSLGLLNQDSYGKYKLATIN
jgi:RecA-family ATPase